jgi:hypothetical protein
MVSVKNERGEEVTRQIVGVGALQPGEARTFSFSVEVFAPEENVGKHDASDDRAATSTPTGPPAAAAKAPMPPPPSPAAKRDALRGVNRS